MWKLKSLLMTNSKGKASTDNTAYQFQVFLSITAWTHPDQALQIIFWSILTAQAKIHSQTERIYTDAS